MNMHVARALVVLVAMPLFVSASYDNAGICELAHWINSQGGTSESIKQITAMGEMAVVVDDPSKIEEDFSCLRLKLDDDNKVFSFKYIDGSGMHHNKMGNLTVKSSGLPPLTPATVYYQLDGIPGTDLLGDGELHPVYVGGGIVMLKTCKPKFLAYTTTTYVLTSIAKAKNYKACNCDAW